MLSCFVTAAAQSVAIEVLTLELYPRWLESQSEFIKNWLASTQFRAQANAFSLLPDAKGLLTKVIVCVSDAKHFWGVGNLPQALPEGVYAFQEPLDNLPAFALAWGLGAYQFNRYKTSTKKPAQLVVSQDIDLIQHQVAAIYDVRDLVNTPTENMGPSELATAARELASQYKASFTEIIGDDLLTENYPCIHTVGRACDDAPRLLDLRWGLSTHRKLTLVGKGVCFDTGGLDIKTASGMTLMKKDMGGAAHVLGLARMIMAAKLPIALRVLIPAVENSVSGNAYRPGDVIRSRKGLTIEIGNTDAEGRVVLADALTEAASENPDLIIDIATLTGAARVALGTELPAMFTNQDAIATELLLHAEKEQDPLWRLPLFGLYRDAINSSIADINNNTADSYAGAITAALFLQEFVNKDTPWVHFDLMAWNLKTRPGRPQGGEAMGLRAMFSFLRAWSAGN